MKLNYTSLCCFLSGISGFVGLATQSVYPLFLSTAFLLLAGYPFGKQRQTITRSKGET